MRRVSRQRGFTIVELLIAAAIFGVILSLLGSLFVSSRRAYNRTEEVSETRQTVQAAVELLNYDIGLAGYRGVDATPATINSTRPFSTLPLTVVDGGTGPDTVTIRFYEDRYVTGGPQLRVVSFTVVDGVLVRTEGGTTSPMVDGVTDLQVNSWLNRAATEFVVPTNAPNANRPLAKDLAGIGLRLTFLGQSQPIVAVIALPNPQCAALPC